MLGPEPELSGMRVINGFSLSPQPTIFQDDFEGGPEGWNQTGGVSETSSPITGSESRKFTSSSHFRKEGLNQDVFVLDFKLYPDSNDSAANWEKTRYVFVESWGNWDGSDGIGVFLNRGPGTEFYMDIARDLPGGSHDFAINEDAVNDIRVKIFANNGTGNDSAELWLNGTKVKTLSGLNLPGSVDRFRFGQDGFNAANMVSIADDIKVFHTDPDTYVNNVYDSAVATIPNEILFDGVVGKKKMSLLDLANQHDWFWDEPAGKLYVHAPGDPDTQYTEVLGSIAPAVKYNGKEGIVLTGVHFSDSNLSIELPGDSTIWLNALTGGDSYSDMPTTPVSWADEVTWDSGQNGGGMLSVWQGSGQDTYVYSAKASDPLVPVYFHPSASSKLISGDWEGHSNSSTIETEILSGIQDRFEDPNGTFIYNPYSTQDSTKVWHNGGQPPASSFIPLEQPVHGPVYAYVPFGVTPSDDGDSHMAVYQPNGRVLETHATIVLSTGSIVCGMASFTDPTSRGDGRQNGRRASMTPNYMGLLNVRDIQAGEIKHALSIIIPARQLKLDDWVSPALAFDSNPGYSGNNAMGTRLAIPWSFDLDSFSFNDTVHSPLVAKAMKHYGLYINDRGGSAGVSINCSQTLSEVDYGNYSFNRQLDLEMMLRELKVVSS